MPHPPRALSAAHPVTAFLVAALTLAAAPARAQQTADAAGEVRLFVTVTDGKGRYLSGLDRSHFSVLEGKVARQITAFESADRPASVGVLVDVSESMEKRRESVGLALGELILKGHPENQYFVADFNARGMMLADWTSDRALLDKAIRQIGLAQAKEPPKGANTALYDACSSALSKLARGPHAKRVLVVVSDGLDNASRTRFKDLLRQIQESDVLIYSLGPGKRASPAYYPDAIDPGGEAVLTELAVQTGGAALFPEGRKEAVGAGEWIAVDLRHKYVVGFAPGAESAGAAGPKWRKIKIKVSAPSKDVKGIDARSREGYLSPRSGS